MSQAGTTTAGAGMLKSYIQGKENGPTIVFVHGFPDDHALWDKQVYRVRCACVMLLSVLHTQYGPMAKKDADTKSTPFFFV